MDAQTHPSDSNCHIDILPADLLACCLLRLQSFKDLAVASEVCRKWREGVRQAHLYRETLSFSGSRMDDKCVARLVEGAHRLRELDISFTSRGCHITDTVLARISNAICCPNLISISLWGVTAVTDDGVIQLVSRAVSLQHLNVGGTFITDRSLFAIANHCQKLKVLNLWGCRRLTEDGLAALGSGCSSLHSINVWGLPISRNFYEYLLTLKPHLQLTGSVKLTAVNLPQWQVAH